MTPAQYRKELQIHQLALTFLKDLLIANNQLDQPALNHAIVLLTNMDQSLKTLLAHAPQETADRVS